MSSPHIGKLQQVKLMKTTPRFIAALALAGAFASTSLSAAESGPYIRLDNGVSSISGANFKIGPTSAAVLSAISGSNVPTSAKIKFDPAYVFGGAVGYRFSESLAAEIELDHAQNEVDTLAGIPVSQTVLDQNITFKQTSLLASGIYTHKVNESIALSLGAGLGAQFCSANIEEGSATNAGVTVSGKQTSSAAFVAQLKTGVSIALAKNFTFDAGYKLRFVSSSDIYEASVASPTLNGSEKWSVDSRLNHVFSAGFTYSF